MGTTTRAEPGAAVEGDSRREEWAVAVFGTWMITGLFLDGWAHGAQKPETFFSPWHGILYSGFVAAVIWFSVDGRRAGGGTTAGITNVNRLTTVGLAVFVAGAVGDGIWHEIFGVEADLEALVSPSHLLLFFGGFLMVTNPLREAALRRQAGREARPTWSQWAPQAITLTLATALVAFFTQYLSPFEGVAGSTHPVGRVRELEEIAGVASVLVFNAIVVLALLYVVSRWEPPMGTATVLLVGVGVGMTGLEGFDHVELVVSCLAGGLVIDLCLARRMSPLVALAAGSAVWWSSFFLIAELTYGVAWTVELWAGAICLATASAALLATIVGPRVAPR
jgi:hypothetical protein